MPWTYNVFAVIAFQVIWACKAADKSTHIGCNDKQSRNWKHTIIMEDPVKYLSFQDL
ncbi:hypothetical protein K435DRAFT_780233 [Dendrothele bispora CBS 962.96]|uniref:Uncharacterized protein n=1 Tax=Dendrothele bispora (strain CBS 962.96) TaxID=1314807 RepID=A0A4S8LTV9_DENBC|nr:hypothetical protein K435DRAFT_780233 [Dendrothele bispora CBS 962.96]